MGMEVLKVYGIRAFVSEHGGGNPAGVVFDEVGLSAEEMQKIAMDVGYSETVFISASNRANFKLRFFTPVNEVPMCGHATVGAFSAMTQILGVKPGLYKAETLAGVLEVHIGERLDVTMAQNLPIYEPCDLTTLEADVAASLEIEVSDLARDLKMEIVSTGLRDLIIPVCDLSVLDKIRPDADAISKISKQLNITGYHVFAKTEKPYILNCRNFAPLCGILEEAATGTSNAALGCYLLHHEERWWQNGVVMMGMKQGIQMGEPSEILVIMEARGDRVISVKVNGKAGKVEPIMEIERVN